MAHYDVHRQANGALLLNVQADAFESIRTRVVVPLLPIGLSPPPARRLNPIVEIDGQRLVVLTQSLAAVPVFDLGPVIANLDPHHDEIVGALDMLFLGF